MKVKARKYCQEVIDGHLTILDAHRLTVNDIVEEIDNQFIDEEPSIGAPENKMINILYKKRGRPRKEV